MTENPLPAPQLPRTRLFTISMLALSVALVGALQWPGTRVLAAANHNQTGKYSLIVSPRSTPAASYKSQISLLGVPPQAIRLVVVIGSRSGRHLENLKPYSDGSGASFVPKQPFTKGERVSVAVRYYPTPQRSEKNCITYKWSFGVGWLPDHGVPSPPQRFMAQKSKISYVSEPSLHSASIKLAPRNGRTSPGMILLTPTTYTNDNRNSAIMLDDNAKPVWISNNVGGSTLPNNLNRQIYRDQPVLTVWLGKVHKAFGMGTGVNMIYNDRYERIATVRAGNGFVTDMHDFIIAPDNSAYVTSFPWTCRQTSSGVCIQGSLIVDAVVQQIDIKTGLVMWEWHALGNIDIADSYRKPNHLQTQLNISSVGKVHTVFDPYHINSIAVAGDDVLVSIRHTSTIYDISKESGAIKWRLGGKRSSFKLTSSARFGYQHDARFVGENMISIFDNHTEKERSQQPAFAKLIELDQKTHQAKLLRRLSAKPPIPAHSQGGAQFLPDGHVFVGSGCSPFFTEFDSSGKVILQAKIERGVHSYRARKVTWVGHPSYPPKIAVKTSGSRQRIFVSWNGATEVASWRVLSGGKSNELKELASAPRNGFETEIKATAPRDRNSFFAVQALDKSRHVLGTSAPVKPLIVRR